MKKISKILSKIPTYPGVYFFKDNNGKILYIGKAKYLKKRVSSYFNKSNKSSKNKLMVSKAKDIEHASLSSFSFLINLPIKLFLDKPIKIGNPKSRKIEKPRKIKKTNNNQG